MELAPPISALYSILVTLDCVIAAHLSYTFTDVGACAYEWGCYLFTGLLACLLVELAGCWYGPWYISIDRYQ
jgi:hypothetical protein